PLAGLGRAASGRRKEKARGFGSGEQMMSPLELAAVLTSVLGIWLTTRRKLSSWPVILVSCVLYALVFRREKLYSDMLLQFVYFAFAMYGWWHWWRNGGQRANTSPIGGSGLWSTPWK